MAKKLSLLLAAVAVLALAVPAFASAAHSITVNGSLAPVNTVITGTSTNAVTQTSAGKLTCAKVVVNGKVTENTGSSYKAVETGTPTTETCFIGGKPVLITNIKLVSLSGSAAGTVASFTFEAHLPLGLTVFHATNVPFTYPVATSDVIKFTNVKLTATPAAAGPATFSGDFTLTSTGGAVVLH